MDIPGITSYGSPSNTASGTADKTMGKDDFLRLFTAQLQAQDPLNPMDSTGFTAQLAQFSSLEQLTNMNSSLTGLLAYQNSLQNTMATSLIGKTVTVAGDVVHLDGRANLRYTLAGDAAGVKVSVYDASGTLVRTEELASQAAGDHTLDWDGRDQNGSALPPGDYHFAVSASDASGSEVAAVPLATGTVTGVGFDNNMTYVTLDGTLRVRLGDIREIEGGA